ncbi:MAG TPA: GNAT family N-acetyltransferase [Candidatus Babeliaceae bacterium]|nr:GNAT family N-acetyltransferase [Candidatus Babeliaceae bacterium]
MEGHSKNEFEIRLALDDDFETIFSIYRQGMENSFSIEEFNMNELTVKFRQNFSSRHGICNFWVAVDFSKNILGWQSLIQSSNNPFRENLYAESSTYIAKDNRFKGVGKALLAHAVSEAEKSHLHYLIGFVTVDNAASVKIVKETGWIGLGVIPPNSKSSNKFPQMLFVRPL